MKRIMSLLALCFSLCAATAFPAVVEDWSAVTNSNTGTYADSNGSKIEFEAIDGPNGGKTLQITSTVVQGGYCGIWHNITGDLSKDGSFFFLQERRYLHPARRGSGPPHGFKQGLRNELLAPHGWFVRPRDWRCSRRRRRRSCCRSRSGGGSQWPWIGPTNRGSELLRF